MRLLSLRHVRAIVFFNALLFIFQNFFLLDILLEMGYIAPMEFIMIRVVWYWTAAQNVFVTGFMYGVYLWVTGNYSYSK